MEQEFYAWVVDDGDGEMVASMVNIHGAKKPLLARTLKQAREYRKPAAYVAGLAKKPARLVRLVVAEQLDAVQPDDAGK